MSNSATLSTFLFYDYETFGTSPSLDRPAQFAAIRSDANFNIISDPEVFYCKPANDYLPRPSAVMVTGITPQKAHKKGINEADFARRIHNLFTVPNTCVVGYNNIRFDDEVTRNIFYRNFYDPYSWSWQNGNSRWDLLDIVRACYALRPKGIVWPLNDNGFPSFRLEHLARANKIEHNNAHEAMADVYATIAITRLVRISQPHLFNYFLKYRTKQKLMTLIDVPKMKPLVYVSSIFGTHRSNISWIAPLAWHPDDCNALIVADLADDITPLLKLNGDTLHERLHNSQKMLGGNPTIPLKLIRLNKCPLLAQASSLQLEDANRLGINREYCLKNLKLLRDSPDVRAKAVATFVRNKPFMLSNNVDAQLYNGFFNAADRKSMNIVLKTEPHKLSTLNITFNDPRIKKLIFNYRARNYPNTLNKIEQIRWLQYRLAIFTEEFFQKYVQEIEILSAQYKGNKIKQKQLRALWQYAKEII